MSIPEKHMPLLCKFADEPQKKKKKFLNQLHVHTSSAVLLKKVNMIFNKSYRKNPKISDTRKFAVITLKVEQDGFSLE